jgi:hypothetical protein
MKKKAMSIEKLMKNRGYSRREFLYFAGLATAAARLSEDDIPRVVRAFETNGRPLVVRVLFACGDALPVVTPATLSIMTELICEIKSFGLAGSLGPLQSARFSERLDAAHRDRDFVLVLDGHACADGIACIDQATFAAATTVIRPNVAGTGELLIATTIRQLLAATDENPVELDENSAQIALEGFRIFRRGAADSTVNRARLPYRSLIPARQSVQRQTVSPSFGGVALRALTSNVPKHKLVIEDDECSSSPFGISDRASFSGRETSQRSISSGEK